MKKIFYILLMSVLVLSACSSDDEVTPNNVINIAGSKYKMPPIDKNIDDLKLELKTMTSSVLVSKNGEITDIKATLKGDKDLFKELHYVISYSNSNFQSFVLTYKFADNIDISEDDKKVLAEYLKKNCVIPL